MLIISVMPLGGLTISASTTGVVGALTMEDVKVNVATDSTFDVSANITLYEESTYVECFLLLEALSEGVSLDSVSVGELGETLINVETGKILISVIGPVTDIPFTMTFAISDGIIPESFSLSVVQIEYADISEEYETIDITDTADISFSGVTWKFESGDSENTKTLTIYCNGEMEDYGAPIIWEGGVYFDLQTAIEFGYTPSEENIPTSAPWYRDICCTNHFYDGNGFSCCVGVDAVLEEGVTYIGSYAFDCNSYREYCDNGCDSWYDEEELGYTPLPCAHNTYGINYKSITIPESVNLIHENAIVGSTSGLVIKGYTNSYAEKYANENNITFESIGVHNHEYANGECICGELEKINYTFTHTMQLKTTEPWGMIFNGIVYNNDIVVDYDTLRDYGMYIIAAEDLEGDATVEKIVANGKVLKKGDSNVNIAEKENKNVIEVIYDEELYTYEMNKEFYAVFYAVDNNGNVSYGEVKARSIESVLEQYKNNQSDYSEAVINLCKKMQMMNEKTTDYRNARPDRYKFNTAKPERLSDYTFGSQGTFFNFEFGHTMQLATIEPWALIFNGIVRMNGQTMDYTACNEYGVIIYDDVDGKYNEAPTIDELLTEDEAYVYNNINGGATIKNGYISADFMEGIYSSQMNKNMYAVFYVKIGNSYYYGNVKTRSMLSVAQQYFDNTESYDSDLIELLKAMKELYKATTSYQTYTLSN